MLAIEWDYYLLHMEDDTLQYKQAGTLDDLRTLLATPSTEFKHVVFDPQTLHDDVLPTLYAHNQADKIQVYFQINDKRVTSYILDEKGSLFIQENDFYDAMSLVNQYEKIFHAVAQRMQYLREGHVKESQPLKYAFHYLEKDKDGRWNIIRHRHNNLFKPQAYINIQILVDKIGDEIHFKAFCDDQEFSSAEHGKVMFTNMANHIIRLRHHHEKYPIYITDIDLSKALLGTELANVQTVHYLKYKKHIENILLDILQNSH